MPADPIDAGVDLASRWARDDPLGSRLTLAAVVAEIVRGAGRELVVVGGTAVDTYVSGALGTSEALPAAWDESIDIDTIVLTRIGGTAGDHSHLLAGQGFVATATGGSWHHPRVPFAVDVVARELPTDYDADYVVNVSRQEWDAIGLAAVPLVGPEDLLFDYLESAVDTRHQRDWARALAIATVMGPDLDLNYLYSKAHWRRDGGYVEWVDRCLKGEALRASG